MDIPFFGKKLSISVGKRENPVVGLDYDGSQKTLGVGQAWAPLSYGEYYPKSVPVYAAIKLRQDAIARVPLKIHRTNRDGDTEWVGAEHPVQQLLDRVNPFWTRGDLWRATETYLGLWGSAYWALERDSLGNVTEIWPLRPDKIRIVPDSKTYIKGYIYASSSTKVRTFADDEIVWLRYFNPLDEYSGMSPIAPIRLSMDMGFDALRSNRNTLLNDSSPGMIITTKDSPTDTQVKQFYGLWEKRFQGPNKAKRPALLGEGMKAENLGFTPKEMEYAQSLLWALGDVARAYNVPLPMLHDLSRATYANMVTARRSFWEDCIVPQLMFYQERIQEMLLPLFDEQGLIALFDTSAVEALQEDEVQKAAQRQIYVVNGIMTPNEIRQEMDLPLSDQEGADDLKLGGAGLASFDLGDRAHRFPKVRDVQESKARAEAEFRAQLTPREKQYRAMMSKLFREQADAMVKAIEERRALRPAMAGARMAEEATIALSNGHREDEPAVTGGLKLFDPEAWTVVFAERARPLVRNAMRSAAEAQIAQFGLGIAFDITQPLAGTWVEDRLLFWADRVNDQTAKLILDELKEANELGESVSDISARIRKIEGFNTKVRSDRIARTEMVSAQNEGHLQAYDQAEVEGKEWLTSGDERVRDDHVSADGQVRRVREDFDVGGEKLPAPGQGGSAGNVINCRCTTIPVFDV